MKRFFLVILVDILVIAVHAHQPETLQLSQALCHELALKNSEDIKIQENALRQAVLDNKIAFASYFPDIDASVMSVMMKDTKISEAMTLQMKGTTMAGVSLTLPLYVGGKITTGNKLAKVGVEVKEIQQEQTRRDVIYEADRAYFSYLAVLSKVKMLEAYMQQMDSLLSMVRLSVDVSMATNSDLLRINAKRSEVEYNLIKARNGAELCRMSLCASLGIDINTPLEMSSSALEESEGAVSPQKGELEGASTRLEYLLLEKNIRVKELEVRNARSGYLPTLAVTGQYSRLGWAYMKGEQQGYAYKEQIKSDGPMLLASLSIPLWHWGKEIKKVKKAKVELENARLDLQKNARLLSIQNKQAINNLEESRHMIATAEKGFTQADDNLRNMRLRFDNSMATLTDLLDAHSQWQEASSNLIEAKTKYKIYESEYNRILGVGF